MEILLIILVAFGASALTFFSGFGLGTLLLPAFALLFPLDVAVALTAIVHLLNNLFKMMLVGTHVDWRLILTFGLPSMLAAVVGGIVLSMISSSEYLNPVIGILIMLFALVELLPALRNITFSSAYIPIGGVLSGFFGGLSGHQGALRSAFLLRTNVTKESFIATGVTIAVMVDVARLAVYFQGFLWADITTNAIPLVLATFAAFGGAMLGNRYLKKVTLTSIQTIVGLLMLALGAYVAMG